MKSGFFKRAAVCVLAAGLVVGASGCTPGEHEIYDNDVDILSFSTQELDGVFNPFYSTSGADSSIVGMTQLGMLANDENGQVAYGEDEAVLVLDMSQETVGIPDVDQITTYSFVLKNNVKFSNGTPVTMKDVLFNLYVYLDPSYYGSSTIYSTDIVGLAAYRTQTENKNEQDSFNLQFENAANNRIEALVEAADDIYDEYGDQFDENQFEDQLKTYASQNGSRYDNIVVDYNRAREYFKEELENDYSNSSGEAYVDTIFLDAAGKEYRNLFTTDVEQFLYEEGFITWNRKDAVLESSIVNDVSTLKSWSKAQAIQYVYDSKMPAAISEVVLYWGTANDLFDYLVAAARQEYFSGVELDIPNISGIQFANREKSVKVNGKEYEKVEYNEDGSPKEGFNEVLTIQINGVDPKAIWNFAFGVAPMYYYSSTGFDPDGDGPEPTKNYIESFDYVSNFGVEYNNRDFQDKVIKDSTKIGVPVGAGVYAASCASGGINNGTTTNGIAAGNFLENSIVYFERNPYFNMSEDGGPAKIKKVQFQVVSSSQMTNMLYTGGVDFVEPNAKTETINEVRDYGHGISYKTVQTLGYGYIGINAGKVPSLKVRQAIMHAINTQSCVDYYGQYADIIYRSMSKQSWAYPEGATAYYPYIRGVIPELNHDPYKMNPDYVDFVESHGYKAGQTLSEEDQIEFIRQLVEDAGYTGGRESNSTYTDRNGNVLKYTFTIVGSEQDHPAWNALLQAGLWLNNSVKGFDINTTTDANGLKKLNSGDLTVWAAAWSSSLDPDMYQVYHIESTATSTLNWGYRQIKANVGNRYSTELGIVNELSELIEQGRQKLDDDARKPIYSRALDCVMQLAVELPTYQRVDLFAYNANKLDESTLYLAATSFKGLTSDIQNVSLVIR